jgi:hypothetical protein
MHNRAYIVNRRSPEEAFGEEKMRCVVGKNATPGGSRLPPVARLRKAVAGPA